MNFILALLALVLLWNLTPVVLVFTLPGVPFKTKLRAAASMLDAAGRGLLVLLPDLLAPFVVPFALAQTKRKDDHLPSWAKWWENDVSINGDRAEYWPLDYAGDCYYATGSHPRSFWARYVWLGLRNRASALSIRMGHRYAEGEYADAQHWGDSAVGRDHEGWTLNRRGPVYQLYIVKRLGDKLCLRVNYGRKVWANEGDHRPVAMIVNIAFSVLRWKGAA